MQELGYLKVAYLSHIRYHGVLLCNEIAVDWFIFYFLFFIFLLIFISN